jgi:starch synthase
MAAGTPVVLSDVVGNRDVVEDGVSGLLVPFGDHGAAADAITGLLADAARRDALARAARARVRCQFDVRRMGDALSEVYRGLTAR